MEYIALFIDKFIHLDAFLNEQAAALGPWLYVVLFAIIFCETGLVVTPILPGDSLLFLVGTLAARPDTTLSLPLLLLMLIAAAILGDTVNYAAGYWIGPRVFKYETSRIFNKKHLLRTHEFYERYGGKTIILARFIPIIRTFAPFVAGIGRMSYFQFIVYNVSGGIAWVAMFLLGGYWFSELPVVKNYFHLVIVAIVVISVIETRQRLTSLGPSTPSVTVPGPVPRRAVRCHSTRRPMPLLAPDRSRVALDGPLLPIGQCEHHVLEPAVLNEARLRRHAELPGHAL
jgi:membrane-associated protein